MEDEGSQEVDVVLTDDDDSQHDSEVESDSENSGFFGFSPVRLGELSLISTPHQQPGNVNARVALVDADIDYEPVYNRLPRSTYSHYNDDDTLHGSEVDSDSEQSGFVGFIPIRMGNLSLISPFHQNSGAGNGNSLEMANDDERFNEDLPAVHSYLGANLEEVSGRKIYTESRYVQIPLLFGEYGPLLPGQTFPLTVRDGGRTAMLRSCVEGDHTFGCVSASQPDGDYIFGTTAEIYEYADNTGTVSIKAKGRQRFQLITNPNRFDVRQFRMAEVYILPEVKLQHPFNALNFKSLNGLRASQKEKCRQIESGLLVWPKWVYDMYDPEKLVERADKLTFLKQGLRKEKGQSVIMPKDPTELSFWIASHLDANKRLFILKLNSPIPRLRWLLSFLSKNQIYICNNCDVVIGKQSDIFAMSIEGAQSTYVNSEGYHHDTVTLLKAENIVPTTPASTHFSWFPGYAWQVAVCDHCKKHLGWQFIAVDSKLWPNKFWGLTRHALETHISFGEGNDPSDQPIM